MKTECNKPSVDVWFVMIGQYLAEIQLSEIWNLRVEKINLNIEKIAFKSCHMKSSVCILLIKNEVEIYLW